MPFEIVLAHGILGFGDELGPEHGVQYFRGVAEQYRSLGHTVVAPSVDPLGSIERRSGQLATKIRDRCRGQRLHVIAHSMGGLDIRRVIAKSPDLAARIKTLVTIATPHLGSPVADAVLDAEHSLRRFVPAALLAALRNNTGALEDLRTRAKPMDVDPTLEPPGIKYVNVACDASSIGDTSAFFDLARKIGSLNGQANDGVVTRESALHPHHIHLTDWPVDHGGAIGWPSGGADAFFNLFGPPAGHLERYVQLLGEFD